MEKQNLYYVLGLGFIFVLSGCVVRTYPLTRDRVDQDLYEGNRGFIQGEAPAGEERERKTERTTHVVEIELYPPIKFTRSPRAIKERAPVKEAEEAEEEEGTEGNRGYITKAYTPKMIIPEEASGTFETYTVHRGDTLQKISQKFYGTTKKWKLIYEANKQILKGPNKIYVGQVLNIPQEALNKEEAGALKEPEENLK